MTWSPVPTASASSPFSQLVREIGHRDRDGIGHGDRSVKWTIQRGAVIRSVTRDGA